MALAASTGADPRAWHPQPQPTSSSGATWWRQERSARSQAVARATGSCRSRRGEEDLADDVGVELVAEVGPAVLTDEASGEALRPNQ